MGLPVVAMKSKMDECKLLHFALVQVLNFIKVSESFCIFALPEDVTSHHLNNLNYQGVNNDIDGSDSSYRLHIA